MGSLTAKCFRDTTSLNSHNPGDIHTIISLITSSLIITQDHSAWVLQASFLFLECVRYAPTLGTFPSYLHGQVPHQLHVFVTTSIRPIRTATPTSPSQSLELPASLTLLSFFFFLLFLLPSNILYHFSFIIPRFNVCFPSLKCKSPKDEDFCPFPKCLEQWLACNG